MQVWDLVTRLGGQMRITAAGTVVGWDFSATLAMASALGIDPAPVAEILPAIEAVMVRALNEKREMSDG
jgi:hypothetical protein